jgi:hypothetical protein
MWDSDRGGGAVGSRCAIQEYVLIKRSNEDLKEIHGSREY